MEWNFESIETPELIRVLCSGIFTSADFAAVFDELLLLPSWHLRIPLLFDYREVEVTGTSPMELMAASNNFIGHNANLAYTRISILFGSQESYETGLRFAAITRQGTEAFVKMFCEEEQAINWVVPQSQRPIDYASGPSRLNRPHAIFGK